MVLNILGYHGYVSSELRSEIPLHRELPSVCRELGIITASYDVVKHILSGLPHRFIYKVFIYIYGLPSVSFRDLIGQNLFGHIHIYIDAYT